jgi:hypothetical protein
MKFPYLFTTIFFIFVFERESSLSAALEGFDLVIAFIS